MTPKKASEAKAEEQITENRWLLFISIAAIAILYFLTLKRTVEGGDSGEMIITAATLGISHPPGYPLYNILGYIFSFLPAGDLSFRLNLFSSLCNLGAAYFLYRSCLIITRNYVLAIFAMFMFALYPYSWRYAVVAEVFALNNLIASGLIYLFIDHIVQREDKRNLRLGAFIVGLGISHHHTIIFVALPLIAHLLWSERKRHLSLKFFGQLVLCGLAGLLPYLYLPIAGMFNPANSWGDQHSLSGIWAHFIRDDYGTFSLAVEGESRFLESVWYYFRTTFANNFWLGGLLFFLGVGYSFAQKSQPRFKAAFVLTLAFFTYILIFHFLSNITQFLDPDNKLGPMYFEVLLRFWLMPHLIFTLLMAVGFLRVKELFQLNERNFLIVSAAVGLSMVSALGLLHFETENQSDDSFVEKQARDTLDALPENALVFISGDTLTNSIRYLQYGESFRRDVTVINRQMLKRSWMKRTVESNYANVEIPGDYFGKGGFNFLTLFRANFAKRPIFISQVKETDDYEMNDNSWKREFRTLPYIHVERIVRADEQLSSSRIVNIKSKLPDLEQLKDRKPKSPEGSWEMIAWRSFWDVHHNFARELISTAISRSNDRTMLESAIQILERVNSTIDEPKPSYYKDLGLAYSKMTLYQPKYNSLTKQAWQKYLANPIANDKDNVEIKKLIDRL